MKTRQIIEIIDSWKVTGHGMIAELKYQGTGLSKGTRLKSRQNGRQWTVNSRLFFNHTFDRQKKFTNEAESFVHVSFKSVDNLEKSKTDILDKEKQGIYQYQFDPNGHNETPKAGELLDIEEATLLFINISLV